MMSPTALRMLAVLALGVSALSACAPAPEPTPTPSPAFTSEEEAFAAAEATFAEYTKATNSTDLQDPATFELVYAWLADDAATSARENYSRLHAAAIVRSGESSFDRMEIQSYADSEVTANLCLDVSEVSLKNPDGTSAVPDDRPPRQPVNVEFVAATTSTGLVISSITSSEALQCEP
ncbi:hypothetical protein [Microbacterium paraoxydans]|uniref:hypothetical protein n=1 Tax=Microbacterium paraoxydans TaxID=199592 RepID=UPI001962D4F0|nr:hypothetical protein [Microbacterium paraoxydans]QXE28758.1 hypothetical protein IZR02_10115 [Microbacterium paraoxydans]